MASATECYPTAPRRYSYTLAEFYHATSFMDEAHEIDKSQGRAILVDGHLFYSPNCTRSDILLPSFSPNPGRDISSIEHPLWWSMDHVHLAFLPLRGQGVHPLDSFLPVQTRFVRSRGQFFLDPSVILGWNRLEFELRWIIRILAGRCKIPPYPSVISSALVKASRHKDARLLRQELVNGKRWFMYWVCQLAYTIAVNISMDGSPAQPTYDLPSEEEVGPNFDWDYFAANAIPPWFDYLGTRNWPQTLLCAIRSCVATFDSNSRVGIFLDIAQPKHYQFSVDWFMKFNVPVWYPWGINEQAAALKMTSVSRLVPLPHHLQHVATILHKCPDENLANSGGIVAPAEQPWNAFLAKRREMTVNMEKRESAEDRRKRLNRERQRPTAGARVFEWEKDDNDVFQRIEVPKAERTDVLENYGRNQKVYDAFFNEWDCIAELGKMDEDEIERMEWGEESILYDPPPPSSPHQGSSATNQQESSKMNPNTEPLTYDTGEFYVPPLSVQSKSSSSALVPESLLPKSVVTNSEVAYVLHEYFGFVPPLGSNVASDQVLSPREQLQLTKAIGLHHVDRKFFGSTAGLPAVNFIQALSSENGQPAIDYWDLRAGNRWPLGSSKRLKYLKRLGSRFIFDFGDAATSSWTLCVQQPEIVTFICRLDEQLHEAGIVMELLTRAIPHHTLVLLPSHTVSKPETSRLPVRLPGYQFTRADYDSYCTQVRNLLSDPRVVRGALMSGGIAWRLAVHKKFDSVVDGPTSDLIKERVGVCFPTDTPGWEYWDDTCTTRELDLLCGAYICYNGQKSPPFVVKSWWPLVSTWNTNVYHPWWTQYYDRFFQARIDDIQRGVGHQPLSQSEWRKIIRGTGGAKRLIRNASAQSLAFLNTAVGGVFPGLP